MQTKSNMNRRRKEICAGIYVCLILLAGVQVIAGPEKSPQSGIIMAEPGQLRPGILVTALCAPTPTGPGHARLVSQNFP